LGGTEDEVRQRSPDIIWRRHFRPASGSSYPEFRTHDCGLRFNLSKIDEMWVVTNIYSVSREVGDSYISGTRIGWIELPAYYPFASQEEADASGKLFSDTWQRVIASRQPIWKRLWNSIKKHR